MNDRTNGQEQTAVDEQVERLLDAAGDGFRRFRQQTARFFAALGREQQRDGDPEGETNRRDHQRQQERDDRSDEREDAHAFLRLLIERHQQDGEDRRSENRQ